MANLNVNPEYDIDMEQLTPETRAHADRFNERYGQLLGNDAFLKGKLEEANTSIERAMAVAQGKSAGLVFNTYAELIAYIAVPANAEKFRLGDQFLIKAMNVPDYWWDNTVTTEQTDAEGNVISAKNSSGKVIGALVELEARKVNLSKYDENDAALFDNMSDQYSASRTYDVGDICIYDNKLYKCVTAVATAEAFDQTKWNKTSFAALHANQEKKISENTQSLANQEKYIFISACSAVNTNVIKRFTLNGSDFEIYLAYTTETSATIAVTIDGIVVNLLGVCWRPGTSNQPSYVNTTNFTMQITSYFEAFTYTKLGYKISAILIGGAGQPTAVFSIESYKLI